MVLLVALVVLLRVVLLVALVALLQLVLLRVELLDALVVLLQLVLLRVERGKNGYDGGKGYDGDGKGYDKGYDKGYGDTGYDGDGKGYDDGGQGYGDGKGKGYDGGKGKGYDGGTGREKDGSGKGRDKDGDSGKGHIRLAKEQRDGLQDMMSDSGKADDKGDGGAGSAKGSPSKGFDKGYDGGKGSDKGYDPYGSSSKGYDAGYDTGYDKGYNKGYVKGYDDGKGADGIDRGGTSYDGGTGIDDEAMGYYDGGKGYDGSKGSADGDKVYDGGKGYDGGEGYKGGKSINDGGKGKATALDSGEGYDGGKDSDKGKGDMNGVKFGEARGRVQTVPRKEGLRLLLVGAPASGSPKAGIQPMESGCGGWAMAGLPADDNFVEPVTLSAIAELLDKKFDERLWPVLDTVRELQDNAARVEANIDNMFERTEEKNAELLSKIETVNEDLQIFKKAATHSGVERDRCPQDAQLQHDLTQQIEQLDAQMRNLMQTRTDDTKLIAVFGGLEGLGD
ncbi:unnamed protein product [Prorocentrum cordatum]|uniref:Uncharacterized protein n=1 Tax=Prorocentrum cordatum TaxID=2364126 RepID=A0ABN9SEE7_9DINO|nr:unnamed protein product [Polarella glacialis]